MLYLYDLCQNKQAKNQLIITRFVKNTYDQCFKLFYVQFFLRFCKQSKATQQNNKIIKKLQYINKNKQNSKEMHRERPRSCSASGSRTSCTHGKPLMQVKYKQRSGNRSVLNDSTYINESIDIPEPKNNTNKPNNKYQMYRSIGDDRKSQRNQNGRDNRYRSMEKEKTKQKRRSNSVNLSNTNLSFDQQKQENFRNTSCKLFKQNFRHHNPQLCVCQHCTCGRHLCQLHAVKPDMTKASNYTRSYPKKTAAAPVIVVAPQYPKLQGPMLNLNSTFNKDYPDKRNDDLSRPKPEDLLKTGGPCQQLSSYMAQYPGHRGPNQYVKPTDKHYRDKFPLRGRTTYDTAFLGQQAKRPNIQVYHNLKPGTGWFGGTTYDNFFKSPKLQNYPAHEKVQQKREINPDYCRQYETTHGNDFKKPPTAVCPAKIELQTKRKGAFRDSKISFKENSDYKAMSPEFMSYAANRAH